jgi:hypothetical protein
MAGTRPPQVPDKPVPVFTGDDLAWLGARLLGPVVRPVSRRREGPQGQVVKITRDAARPLDRTAPAPASHRTTGPNCGSEPVIAGR